jgi:hypothetical protein
MCKLAFVVLCHLAGPKLRMFCVTVASNENSSRQIAYSIFSGSGELFELLAVDRDLKESDSSRPFHLVWRT